MPLCKKDHSHSAGHWLELHSGLGHKGQDSTPTLPKVGCTGSAFSTQPQFEARNTLQSLIRMLNSEGNMKRLKRDPLERAFLRGYQYGVHGKSRELCPFTLPAVRQAWINGWREGRGDNWDGMTGTAGIQRLNELHATG